MLSLFIICNYEAIKSGDILLELGIDEELFQDIVLALYKQPLIYGHSYHAILPNIERLNEIRIFTIDSHREVLEDITDKVYNPETREITIEKARYPIYIGFDVPPWSSKSSEF